MEMPLLVCVLRQRCLIRLVDVSADTIGFLSQPNVVTFQGEFPDKRPKPEQVVGVGDVLNITIFEAAPGGLFTPGNSFRCASWQLR